MDSIVELPNGPRIHINPKTKSYIRSILKKASERNITTFDGLLKFRTDRMKQPESTLLRENDVKRYVDSLIEENQGEIDISFLKFHISTEKDEEKLKKFLGEIANKFMEPKNVLIVKTEAKPGGESDGSMNRITICTTIAVRLSPNNIVPIAVTKASGALPTATIPLIAHPKFRFKLLVEAPNIRSGRT